MRLPLSEPLSQLRTVVGLGSFLPIAAGALGLGVLSGNRRDGVNFFTGNWPRLMLAAGGVSLNVLGSENLTAQRPAVFIFNHRNVFDVFVTAALVRDDWTAVGKKELENDPIAGTIGRIVDAAFIDRDDPRAAVEGLRKVEELAKKGLSIIIAPEGTRVDTPDGVGPFKKGPFRIAMTANIPIVPVVIRNAESIAPRDSTIVHPCTVDVAVFPPVSVDGWTHANLPEHIAAVHDLYRDTLAAWPRDKLPHVQIGAQAATGVKRKRAAAPKDSGAKRRTPK
jgi:putative phosphoserine phosphatase / 1-acylglycerol-3-phosphate O-acyltransferase